MLMYRHYLKIFWRTRYNLLQSFASISIFLLVLGFIQTNLTASIVWLFWCWHLIGLGSDFWRDEFEDYACLQWLFKPYAQSIIDQKWYSYILCNTLAWLSIWHIWLVITGINGYLWLIMLILATIPIMLGFGAFMAAISANFIGNTCLLNLTVLPIVAPVLIYGSGIFWQISASLDPSHIIAGVVSLAILMLRFLPKLFLRALRISLPEEI